MNDALASLMMLQGAGTPSAYSTVGGADDAALKFQLLMQQLKNQGQGAASAAASGAGQGLNQGLGYATDALTMVGPMSGRFAGGYLQGANLLPTASGLSGSTRLLGAGRLPAGRALINPVTGNLGKAAMAGKFLGRATPYMPAIGNVLEGDLVGAGASAGGALAGAAIGSVVPVIGTGAGAIIGGMVGEPIVKGAGRLASGLVGINPGDPLSGPDWNLGPFALTPYAKTKKRTKRGVELAKLQLPLYNEIANEALNRQLQRDQLAQVGSLINNVYSNNPYMR